MELYNELNKINNYKSICIIGHTSPDADAFASMVVLKNFLKSKFDISADLFAECSKIQFQYRSLLGDNQINLEHSNYDVAFMLDSPNSDRFGCYENLFNDAKLKIVIDHHQTNLFQGDINIVEKQSSTCEIIYEILKHHNYQFTQKDKENIYAGIITDTNNFTVGNFNKKTFEIAGEIVEHIDHEEIYNHLLRNNSLKNMQLLATAIKNISAYEEGSILISHITSEEAHELNAKFDDFIGIINKLATINNSKLVCFIYPKCNDYYVSMRARHGLKVSSIAKENGGGGHDGAAAFLTSNSIEEIKENILQTFKKLLKTNS